MRLRRRGGSAVEFALVSPLLFVLLAGIVEWGWYLFQLQMVLNATSDGVRAGSRTAVSAVPGPEAVAADLAARRLVELGVAGDLSSASAAVTVDLAGTIDVPEINVTIDVPVQPLVGLIPMPPTLFAEATLLVENPN